MILAALSKWMNANIASVTYDADGHEGNLFWLDFPDQPDEAVMLTPTGGEPPPDGAVGVWERPSFQVRVRGAQQDTTGGYERALEIYDELQGLSDVTMDPGGPDEVYVHKVESPSSGPGPLGLDDSERQEWSLNFILEVPSAAPHRIL